MKECAVVTGAAGGIGTAICSRLAKAGLEVLGIDLVEPPCKAPRSSSAVVSQAGCMTPSSGHAAAQRARRDSAPPANVGSDQAPALDFVQYR
jgi:NAD(P)-dependent dehydrogenase (short-subunit alcohol dehydrogenase family)